ncbi:MAG TPA: hypothetical protein VN106_04500 [Sphingomicrobium sp.]|jgi:hypothetical protein|nr:hypothetical protein [Sphingomicrobium sp.]
MSLLALALLSQAAPPPDAEAASKAAVQVFEQGCVQGALKLSPGRARVLKDSEVPPFADVLDKSGLAKLVVVQMYYPPATYLVSGRYDHLQKHSIANQCVVISRVLNKVDAMTALMATAPKAKPVVTYHPVMYFPEWTIDQPKQGFMSRMRINDDNSILIEVATYNNGTPQAGPKHQ